MARLSKVQAERHQALLEERDAQIQAGGVAKHIVQAAAATRTSSSLGSFSTPIKVTLPKVKEGQMIEVRAAGFAKCSVKTKAGIEGSVIGISFAGGTVPQVSLANGIEEVAANALRNISTQQLGGHRCQLIRRGGIATGQEDAWRSDRLCH